MRLFLRKTGNGLPVSTASTSTYVNALPLPTSNSDGISNGVYRDINNMTNVRDDKKANIELNQMVELGILETIGDNKARRYVIAAKFSE